MSPDDAELMRRWREGDLSAFEAVVRRWQQPVGRILARLVGRTELVQDLCQEVFLKVYHSGSRYRETGAFATWIHRITLNVARDAGRRRRHQPGSLGDQEPASHVESAAAHCQQQETIREVARAVAELPEPLREVLVLHHYEQLNFEEIARLTDTPASTLKSRFAVALNRLRDCLHERGLAPEESTP